MLNTSKRSNGHSNLNPPPSLCLHNDAAPLLTRLIPEEEAQDQEQIISCVAGSKSKKTLEHENVDSDLQRKYIFWIEVAIYTILLQAGQVIGTILGGIYFDNGGNSKWLATLLQLVGFPVLIPFLFISPAKRDDTETNNSFKPSLSAIVLVYIFLGILQAASSMSFSIGLKNLPVSTYTLICASQLAFNALFSVIFNAQKLTPFILNSLFLLTISSVLLVFQNDSEDTDKNTTHRHFALGFICTVVASAGNSLMLSLTELSFRKVFRKEIFRVIIDMSIYQSLVATIAILVGFFASGDWKTMDKEMEEFKGGGNSLYQQPILDSSIMADV